MEHKVHIGQVVSDASDAAPKHDRPPRTAARALGALAVGALAFGAIAIGTIAIGALAIGRLVIGRARFRRLEVDELVVHRRSGKDAGRTTD